MATDATGTPTTLGIPTYDVNVDAPSGNGFNAVMAVIDTLIQGRQLNPQIGSQASSVSTSSSTFGAGVDVLASALSFTAPAGAKYRLRIVLPRGIDNSTGGAQLHVNLDSADGGVFGNFTNPGTNEAPATVETIIAPAAGAHTVNVRLTALTTGTATIQTTGTTGIFVTLDRIL